MSSQQKPQITAAPNGPLLVKGLTSLSDKHGAIDTKENMALCRCGQSSNKPFCDGTHAKIGFSSEKLDGRIEDKRDNYVGKKITIHDNRGICAHAGYCTDNLPAVWRMKQEPWIDPDAAEVEEIIAVIQKCPSGALSYTIDDVEYRDLGGDPAVFVVPNGPYKVSGGVEVTDEPRAEGVSEDHCTLCRCGGSKNKPFCDGTHWYVEFDEKK